MLFLLSGCVSVHEVDHQIRAHWMEANETAPYDGILLDEHTYYRIMDKLNRCKYGQ